METCWSFATKYGNLLGVLLLSMETYWSFATKYGNLLGVLLLLVWKLTRSFVTKYGNLQEFC